MKPDPAGAPRINALPEKGHVVEGKLPDVIEIAHSEHGLAQALQAAMILYLVNLIDDVDQACELGLAPEHDIRAHDDRPWSGICLKLRLPQVKMGAARVGGIEAKEGREDQRGIQPRQFAKD